MLHETISDSKVNKSKKSFLRGIDFYLSKFGSIKPFTKMYFTLRQIGKKNRASTMEANAAMRSIVRKDTNERYRQMLHRMTQKSDMDTPTTTEQPPTKPAHKKRVNPQTG